MATKKKTVKKKAPDAPIVKASKPPAYGMASIDPPVPFQEDSPISGMSLPVFSPSGVMPLIVCYGCAQRVPANTMSVIMSPTARHVCPVCKPLYDSGRKLTHTL